MHLRFPRAPLDAALIVGFAALSCALSCATDEPPAPVPTAEAEARDIERVVVATGTVEPEGELQVRPRIAGIVERIHVSPGDEVKVGDILVEIEKDLLEARAAEARAGVQAARVEVRFAKVESDRSMDLRRQGASSDSKRDRAMADYHTAVANLARAEAILETFAVQLDHAAVRSPLTGRVLDVPVEVGTAVSPVTAVTGGSRLLSLAATDRLHLDGSVDENEIAHVRLGQPARIRTEAFGDRTFQGIVRDIAPIGERIQNVTYFAVEIEITDPAAAMLRPRMSGDAEIVTETIDEAIVIPETALRYAGEDVYVRVLSELVPAGASPEHRSVRIGVVEGNRVQIVDGLERGERVSLQ